MKVQTRATFEQKMMPIKNEQFCTIQKNMTLSTMRLNLARQEHHICYNTLIQSYEMGGKTEASSVQQISESPEINDSKLNDEISSKLLKFMIFLHDRNFWQKIFKT